MDYQKYIVRLKILLSYTFFSSKPLVQHQQKKLSGRKVISINKEEKR